MDNKLIKYLIYLIILDLFTTTISILIGGIEYNPISMGIMKESYILYIIVKILICIGFYIFSEYTDIFDSYYSRIISIPIIIYFIIVNFLNCLYIILKLFGVI